MIAVCGVNRAKMPFTNLQFVTQGTWETTSLLNAGIQVDARAIYLHFESEIARNGLDGGVDDGVIINEARLLIPQPGVSQDQIEDMINVGNYAGAYALCFDQPIFPGSIEFQNGTGNGFRIEWLDVTGNTTNLRVFLEGLEITDDICELYVKIDSISNECVAWLTYVDNRVLTFFSTLDSFTTATYNLF